MLCLGGPLPLLPVQVTLMKGQMPKTLTHLQSCCLGRGWGR